MIRTSSRPFLVVFALSLVACAGAGAASRPADISASHATGESAAPGGACNPAAKPNQVTPFVADWTDGERSSLESAMKKGVAVVSWTCEGVKVLPACRVKGDYAYSGVSPKSRLVKMHDAGEIRANMPGAAAAKFEAEMKQNRELALAFNIVGTKATSVTSAERSSLEGSCEGATHFVYSSEMGAFKMASVAAGSVKAAAQLWGYGTAGGAEGDRSSESQDGDVESCKEASSSDEKPRNGCEALVRLTLLPIVDKAEVVVKVTKGKDDDKKPTTKIVDARSCEAGFVYSGDGCVRAEKAENFLCKEGDFEGCMAQCEKGSEPSCGRLAAIVAKQYNGGPPRPLTSAQVAVLRGKQVSLLGRFQTTCDAGEAQACGAVGAVIEDLDEDVRKKMPNLTGETIAKAYEKGCQGGEPGSCSYLSSYRLKGSEGAAKNPASYRQTIAVGCRKGAAEACYEDGKNALAGIGGPVDLDDAYASFVRACTGGDSNACTTAAALVDSDCATRVSLLDDDDEFYTARDFKAACQASGRSLDAGKAKAYYGVACKKGIKAACTF